jgi:S1-C subfamily serine protease
LLNHNGQFMLVSCPCGEIDFTPNPPNCLRVSIWEEGGDLYRSGLRTGDIITAVDGAGFDSKVWGEAIEKSAAERDLRLSVRRGGSNVQVSVPNRAFDGNPGGTWQVSYEP